MLLVAQVSASLWMGALCMDPETLWHQDGTECPGHRDPVASGEHHVSWPPSGGWQVQSLEVRAGWSGPNPKPLRGGHTSSPGARVQVQTRLP